jgi:hypothetical protein
VKRTDRLRPSPASNDDAGIHDAMAKLLTVASWLLHQSAAFSRFHGFLLKLC